MYGIELAAARRAMGPDAPDDDVTALLLATEVEGHNPMDDLQFAYFFVQLVTAGNDTTPPTMISSGLLEMLEHPDQLAALRADRSLVPDAVQEILRHAPPSTTSDAPRPTPRSAAKPLRRATSRDDLLVGQP